MYSDRYALANGLPTVSRKPQAHRARVDVSDLQTLSVREAAAILGVPKSTVHGWMKHGRRGIRLEPSALLEFIRRTNAR